VSLTEDLLRQLSGAPSRAVGDRLGLDAGQAATAIAAAVPMLLGGLARNASAQGGGASLAGALDRDHDGSVLDDVVGHLGQGGDLRDGAGILGHVFGLRGEVAHHDRRQHGQQLRSRGGVDLSGLGSGLLGKLLGGR